MTARDPKTGRFVSNKRSSNGAPNGLSQLAINRLMGQFLEGQSTTLDSINELITNEATLRSRIIRNQIDARRNIDDECGYPDTLEIANYVQMYHREPVAGRVVDILPEESWMMHPRVFETEDPEENTPFEIAWDGLKKRMRSGWFQDDEGDPIWELLLRADKISGIGTYGVVLLGLDDTDDLLTPAFDIDSEGTPIPVKRETKLLYARTYREDAARITAYDENPRSPRFGQPVKYELSLFNLINDETTSLSAPPGTRTLSVHWTRIVHLADNLMSSEVFGIPRMQPVFNRIWDIHKVLSGSGEMYWRGAFPGLSVETHPSLSPETELDLSTAREEIEKGITGLQRYWFLKGVTVKSIAPQVVDPTPQVDKYLEEICIRMGIPKRIFTGSERGELASSQDTKAWADRMKARQSKYITPRVIVPFINRLITVGVLPEPNEGYSIDWPDLAALSEKEKAEIAVRRTEAMAKYVQGNIADTLMTPMDFLTREMGYTEQEAMAILEEMEALIEEGIEDAQPPTELPPDPGDDRDDEGEDQGGEQGEGSEQGSG